MINITLVLYTLKGCFVYVSSKNKNSATAVVEDGDDGWVGERNRD